MRFLGFLHHDLSAHQLATCSLTAAGRVGTASMFLQRLKICGVARWLFFWGQAYYISRGGLDTDWKPMVFGVEVTVSQRLALMYASILALILLKISYIDRF